MPLPNDIPAGPPFHLITGAPGTGKTTAIKTLVSDLPVGSFSGFYTEEIREPGGRVGFLARTFAGEETILAHVSLESGPRVGKYRVDIHAFERAIVPEIDPAHTLSDLYVIDEIGKMECFSDYFVRCVRDIMSQERGLVATVALKGGGLIKEIKRMPGATIHTLDRGNRDRLPSDIVKALQSWMDR